MTKWISIDDQLPKENEEVTVYLAGGQIRQVVRDKNYGGWKEPSCGGWVQAGSEFVTHWTRRKLKRPIDKASWANGPDNAPWHKVEA